MSMMASSKCGWHRVRFPGWLIMVEFLFGHNDSFIYSLLLPPPPPVVSASVVGSDSVARQ